MGIKTVRRKGKRPAMEKGEPRNHKQIQDHSNPRPIRQIRGVFKAWSKAPKFLLRVKASNDLRLYLSKEGNVTVDRKEAKQFALGFDNPETKAAYWSNKFNLIFIQENL
jgi:hypothetical protein